MTMNFEVNLMNCVSNNLFWNHAPIMLYEHDSRESWSFFLFNMIWPLSIGKIGLFSSQICSVGTLKSKHAMLGHHLQIGFSSRTQLEVKI